jgi:hypothetical protein
MTNKLSGRYCFEVDEGSNYYCIPIELRTKFHEMLQNIGSFREMESEEEFNELNLFIHTFENYKLENSFSEYSFTDLQEIEE